MKKTLLNVLASMLVATTVSAQDTTPLPPAPEKDPFVGIWQANQEKSRPKLGKKDASYRRTIDREGEDLVFSSRIGDSRPSENNYKIRCDGRFHRVPFGSLSCRYTGMNFIEGETINVTHETEYWSREVSADGQEMKISAYRDSRRTKLKSIWILDRVK
jgi:hypothetical protein